MNQLDTGKSQHVRGFDERQLWVAAAVVLVASLFIAPFFSHLQDVYGCWLNWARVTDGTRPWNLYLSRVDAFNRPLDCNYPPFVLYLLTAVQCVLNTLSLPQFGSAAVTMVKIPGIFGLVLTGWVVSTGLTPLWGKAKAARAAVLSVLCLPAWFNAAVWGQWDTLLCLAIICALLAVLRVRPRLAGAALGWALAVKLQAIVAVPAILVFAIKTWSRSQVATLLASAAVVWIMIAGPFFIAGAGGRVWNSYFGAINHYPLLSVCAGNVWMLTQTCTPTARNWSFAFGRTDNLTLIGSITAKQIGLSLFGLYTICLMFYLSRRPSPRLFLHCSAMTAFAFFMLPTEMHERYLLPACAIFAILAADGRIWFFLVLSVCALVNECAALVYQNQVARHLATDASRESFGLVFLVLSVANIILFVIGTVHVFQSPASLPISAET